MTNYRLEATEIKTYKVRMLCSCSGEYICSVSAVPVAEAYAHYCNNCETKVMCEQRYPAIQYRAAGENSFLNNPL